MNSLIVSQKSKLQKGLPKKTKSLCPECNTTLDAVLSKEGNKVIIEKTCKKHGAFKDTYWSNVNDFLRVEKFAHDGVGVKNPNTESEDECPKNCGLCDEHYSNTVLGIVDLTNRCNLSCPICFANANASGHVFEPSYDAVVKMLEILRAERPIPPSAVQFSGGEPTIASRLPDIIQKASELGFKQIQIATNGLKISEDKDYLQKLANAHLHTLYLQFDGLKDEIYMQSRGRALVDVKKKVIENCRKINNPYPPSKLSIVLVPTIVNTINDDQVGPILDFAIDNRDVVRGVNYQPVAFTGRINDAERAKQRFTLPDLVDRLIDQTGYFEREDFFPVPCVVPISNLASYIKQKPKMALTAHPHCGLATYIFINKKKTGRDRVIPLPRFVDAEQFFEDTQELFEDLSQGGLTSRIKTGAVRLGSKSSMLSAITMKRNIKKYINLDKLPDGITEGDVTDMISSIFMKADKRALANFAWESMFIGAMHFMDSYNYDVERVKRCLIHYPTPDGRIIPFCSYNGGPFHRKEVEEKYSVTLAEWKAGKAYQREKSNV